MHPVPDLGYVDFRILYAGTVLPNSDLRIEETSLGNARLATLYVMPNVRPLPACDEDGEDDDDEEDEDADGDEEDEEDNDGNEGGADKGSSGGGGGCAGGGAASGGGMGGNGGNGSAEGGRAGQVDDGAFGVLNRIKVKSTAGHEFTINNTSLRTTSCALYESIAERCGMSADALGVLHSGRELPNDDSELRTTTLGGSHIDKRDELHLTVLIRTNGRDWEGDGYKGSGSTDNSHADTAHGHKRLRTAPPPSAPPSPPAVSSGQAHADSWHRRRPRRPLDRERLAPGMPDTGGGRRCR